MLVFTEQALSFQRYYKLHFAHKRKARRLVVEYLSQFSKFGFPLIQLNLDLSRILRDSFVSCQFSNLDSLQTFLWLIQSIAALIVSFVVNSASYVSYHII